MHVAPKQEAGVYVIAGAAGRIGVAAAQMLLDRGEPMRPSARRPPAEGGV